MGNLDVLLSLAKRGRGTVKICTGELAHELGISQQSASRKLQELEQEGLIERNPSPSGIEARVTQKGSAIIESQYRLLKGIIEKKTRQALSGSVLSGMGEGKYYIGMDGYRRQIKEKLGFEPYAGTLNLKLSNPQDSYILEQAAPVVIGGFKTDTRTYGALRSYPVLIGGTVKGAVIKPERTHYGADIVELIAQPFLRKKLGVKDGDKVRIEVLA